MITIIQLYNNDISLIKMIIIKITIKTLLRHKNNSNKNNDTKNNN